MIDNKAWPGLAWLDMSLVVVLLFWNRVLVKARWPDLFLSHPITCCK